MAPRPKPANGPPRWLEPEEVPFPPPPPRHCTDVQAHPWCHPPRRLHMAARARSGARAAVIAQAERRTRHLPNGDLRPRDLVNAAWTFASRVAQDCELVVPAGVQQVLEFNQQNLEHSLGLRVAGVLYDLQILSIVSKDQYFL